MSDPTPPGEPDPRPGWGTPPGQPPAGPYGPPTGQPSPPGGPYPPQGVPYPPPGGQYPPQGVPYPSPGGTGRPGWYPTGPVTNQKSQWALAVGLLSVPAACCSGFLGLVGIVAVVLGVQARREITASAGQQTGGGLAVTGIVSGILGTLLAIGLMLVFVLLLAAGEWAAVSG